MRELVVSSVALVCLTFGVTLCAQVADTAGSVPEPVMMSKPTGEIAEQPHDPHECAPAGIAVGGYDLISYRLPDGPILGDPKYAVQHGQFTYLFATEEHRQLFQSHPATYLPGYSGWCAVTLALGRLTCPDHSNFRLEQGQLLLFETTGFTNGRTLWETDTTGFRRKADVNFEKLLGLQ